ncbi:MAG: efflux RND transporter permease subunit [Nannocystis sp.]|nr:efflux RND transporter permease subunit [Nannocystis sp.]
MSEPAEKIEGPGAIAWMARNPVAANLVMVFLLIGGLLMGARVKQEVFPETELDMISISVPYPGASPAEVEQGIILAVEEAVRGIDGVKRVVATAAEGRAFVTAELQVSADKEKALADIKSAVDRITSLPKETERPVVSMLTNRSEVLSVVIYGQQNLEVLRNLAEQARDQFLTDPRITQVDLAGAPPREISIEVPREQLRVHGLTLDAIAQKVTQTSLQMPGGGVKTATGEVLVRTNERRADERGFADIPVVTGPAGTEIRLGEIARVRKVFAETDESASFDGMPAIMIRVFRIGEQKPLEVAAAVREQSEKVAAFLPAGVKIAQWRDMSEIYAQRIDLLMRNAYLGLALVMICLGLFLELRVAFWVTMGIPISFMGALMLMPSLDVSVNMITLFAFIVVLGMVVDDAIVVGENIFERTQRGESYIEAAIGGTKEVGVPVVFSVLTTVAAFTPMFFVPGFSGKLFSVIPVIVISVLLISLFESLFILPAHLGHMKKPSEKGVYAAIHRQQQKVTRGLERFIIRFYTPLVRAALRWRYLTIAVGVAMLIVTIGYVRAGLIGFRFFPAIDGDVVTCAIELPLRRQRRADAGGAEAGPDGRPGAARGARRRLDQARALRPDRLARAGDGSRRGRQPEQRGAPRQRAGVLRGQRQAGLRDLGLRRRVARAGRASGRGEVGAVQLQHGPERGAPGRRRDFAPRRQGARGGGQRRGGGAARLRRRDGRRERRGARQAAARPDAAAGGGEPGAQRDGHRPPGARGVLRQRGAAPAGRAQRGAGAGAPAGGGAAQRERHLGPADPDLAGRGDRAARGGGDQARPQLAVDRARGRAPHHPRHRRHPRR